MFCLFLFRVFLPIVSNPTKLWGRRAPWYIWDDSLWRCGVKATTYHCRVKWREGLRKRNILTRVMDRVCVTIRCCTWVRWNRRIVGSYHRPSCCHFHYRRCYHCCRSCRSWTRHLSPRRYCCCHRDWRGLLSRRPKLAARARTMCSVLVKHLVISSRSCLRDDPISGVSCQV